MKDLTSYMFKLLIFSVIVYCLFYFATPYLPEKFRFTGILWLILFFIGVTVVFHVGLVKAGEKSNQAFVRFYMGGTAIRLFLFMAVIIVYALMGNPDRVAFIMNFFILYMLYTTFEVAAEYKKFSQVKGPQVGTGAR